MIAAAGPVPRRGDMVDRRRPALCASSAWALNTRGKPTIVLEAGAYRLRADFGTVQDQLTAKGLRNCAYDRAGMGYSDPSPDPARRAWPSPRTWRPCWPPPASSRPTSWSAIPWAACACASFSGRNPGKVVGVVMVDATTPEAMQAPQLREFIGHFATASRWAGVGASLGLFTPIMGTGVAQQDRPDRRGPSARSATSSPAAATTAPPPRRSSSGPSRAAGRRRGPLPARHARGRGHRRRDGQFQQRLQGPPGRPRRRLGPRLRRPCRGAPATTPCSAPLYADHIVRGGSSSWPTRRARGRSLTPTPQTTKSRARAMRGFHRRSGKKV